MRRLLLLLILLALLPLSALAASGDFLGEISSPYQIAAPYGVATGPDGTILVANTERGQLLAYAPDGTLLRQFGDDLPHTPSWRDIAVASDGTTYALDATRREIYVFSDTGERLYSIGSDTLGVTPYAIALDAEGSLYAGGVLPSTGGALVILRPDGASETLPLPLPPDDVAVGADGMIAVGTNRVVYLYRADLSSLGLIHDPYSYTSFRALAFDAHGFILTLYTSNQGRGLQRWSPSGALISSFPAPVADGDLCVTEEGRILLSDVYNDRLLFYSTSGALQQTWARFGSEPGLFYRPGDVARGTNGLTYALDSYNHRIQVFDDAGALQYLWGNYASSSGSLSYPSSLALGPQNEVVVVDRGNARLQVFAADGAFLRGWTSYLEAPQRVATDAVGNIYVTDSDSDRVHVFDLSGQYLRWWGGLGTAPGHFDNPLGVAVDTNGFVYVAENTNQRIQVFTSGGAYVRQWPLSFAPSDLAVDDRGHLYVADTFGDKVEVYTTAGEFVRAWGNRGFAPGEFASPEGLGVGADGRVYVADSSNHRIQIFTGEQRPVAEAGADRSVSAGVTVTLDGSGSHSPSGEALSFAWHLVSTPAGSAATLINSNTVTPSFHADLVGDYVIELVVTDASGADSAPDTVVINTENTAPVANAGADQSVVILGTQVQLDGTESFDPDGDAISYLWQFMQKPAASGAALSDPASAAPTFLADVQGRYEIALTVSDPWSDSAPDTVVVSFDNLQPVAVAGDNQSVRAGATITLDGAQSFDANGDALSYTWSLSAVPEGSAAFLIGANSAQASFVADVPGTYAATLTVHDGRIASEPSTVLITAVSAQNEAIDNLNYILDKINLADDSLLKNKAARKHLTGDLTIAIGQVDTGQYALAIDTLTEQIQPRMDGCGDDAEANADKNDWVACELQVEIYPYLLDTLSLLYSLL